MKKNSTALEFGLPIALWEKFGHLAGPDGWTEIPWSAMLRSHAAGPTGRIPPAELRQRVIPSLVRQGVVQLRRSGRACFIRLRRRSIEELNARLLVVKAEFNKLQDPFTGKILEGAGNESFARRLLAESKALQAERADLLNRVLDDQLSAKRT